MAFSDQIKMVVLAVKRLMFGHRAAMITVYRKNPHKHKKKLSMYQIF